MADPEADDSITKQEQAKAAAIEKIARSRGDADPVDPARSKAVAGVLLGGGLASLGILAAIIVLLDPVVAGDASQAALAARWLRAAWLVLAFGLTGSAVLIAMRSSSSLVCELLDRDARRYRRLEDGLDRAVGLLERIALGLEHPTKSSGPEPPAESNRSHAAKELDNRLAELDAARAVNDPARVFELYEMVAPALEAEPRGSLQAQLAEWFLTLIYRRLRTGKIQVDVVELAERFAESFAATVQGASVRAALPTLRRSAGLCPQCAQPYIGAGQACPQCLRRGNPAAVPDNPSVDASQPE